MVAEWKTTKLGECADWLSGGTPFKGNNAFWSGPIPWVSAKDMKSFRLHDAEDHISPLAVGNGGKVVPAGTILLLVRGMTLHNDVPICMVTREMAFNQDIKALRPAKNVDGAFLAYWLLAHKPDLLASVDHAGHGTGRLVTDTLKGKTVQLPPLAEQKAIAGVLGALDDKIELNRRMNATLEAMARALFQSWFIDFDPVRWNMDRNQPSPQPSPTGRGRKDRDKHELPSPLGRRAGDEGAFGFLDARPPAGLDPATAALFPDHLEDSPLGHIPKGWRVMKVGEFINRLPVGQKYEQKTVLPVGKVSVLDQGKSGVIGYHNNEPGVAATLDEPVAVFANHTCYMRLITFPFSAIQNVLPFVGSGVDTLWAYYATEGRLSFSEYKGHWPDFVIQEAAVPSRELTDAFGELVKPLVASIQKNEEESRTLATLRDTLLPKLLSGELSIN